ncbi:MAG TPA: hypothetical protein VNE61_08780 [Ktedonobacteraceae bacterium]|nr:hypothetical protein [Ktedonobacteraceae bacterium]
MGSGVKDGHGPATPVIQLRISKVSNAAWPLHLRRSLVIKRQPYKARILPALRSLLTRLLSLPPRTAFSRSTLPETPMPAEPLIRVLETFDLSRESVEEKTAEQVWRTTIHSDSE